MRALALAITLPLAACTQTDSISRDTQPYDGIADDAKLTLIGTEPFWSLKVEGETATYSTPENVEGSEFAIERFAGNNGLGLSGELNGDAVQATITPGECSDAMSDRLYPFTATVAMGETTLFGCAYSDSAPFTGGE